jgi:O-antigen/teichoic acid export membrane protein
LILLLPLTALTSVMVETLRAVFQGMLRFVWFGGSWLVWCFAQFVLGSAGLLLLGAPWAVFAGMLVANTAVLGTLAIAARRLGRRAVTEDGVSSAGADPVVASLRAVLPLCVALTGFILLSNADVLVAYVTLSATALGTYSASALLPKAIITATHAVSQVILPVASHIRSEGSSVRVALAKAVALTSALAGLGALGLWLVATPACGGSIGIQFCDRTLLLLLAGAAIAVSVIRTAVVADVIADRRWRPHLPLAVFVAFTGVGSVLRPDAASLAALYSLACWGLLAVLALSQLVERRRRSATW